MLCSWTGVALEAKAPTSRLGWEPAIAHWMTDPAPMVRAMTVKATAATIFNLLTNMACKTPCVRAATELDMSPLAAFPAANSIAALVVESTSNAGTAADEVFMDRCVANQLADRASPRLARLYLSCSRPRDRRERIVPGGHPKSSAASSVLCPCK